jgi:hypothetical protein
VPTFNRITEASSDRIAYMPDTLVMGAWTARDPVEVRKQIDELAAIGMKPPSTVPLFYKLDPMLLSNQKRIQVLGEGTSGEAEVVLVAFADGLWVGLGSDHTDRATEVHSIPLSKQLCRKPMASELWRFVEVEGHWDQLVLRAHIIEDERRVLYQEGTLDSLLMPHELVDAFAGDDEPLPSGTVLFTGAMHTIGPVRSAPRFEMELVDPVLHRRLYHAYDISVIPIAS